jgi:hypothetical protein
MEMSQRNSLYSYLYLKQAKMSFFLFFSSTKSENNRVEQFRERRLVSVRREVAGKGVGE